MFSIKKSMLFLMAAIGALAGWIAYQQHPGSHEVIEAAGHSDRHLTASPASDSRSTTSHEGEQGIPFPATSQASRSGRYRVELKPLQGHIPLLKLHSWAARFYKTDGSEVQPQNITISGSMPAHGHGLPTEPGVSVYSPDTGYAIHGVRFNMAGNWKLIIGFFYANQSETAVLELNLSHSAVSDTRGNTQAGQDQIAPNSAKASNSASELQATESSKRPAANDRTGQSSGDSGDQHHATTPPWSKEELAILNSLSLDTAKPKRSDQVNNLRLYPAAAELGHQLFFDTRLSHNNAVSCATCHIPTRHFSDGRAVAKGLGTLSRNTPTIVGAAYQQWLYWDGRRDTLWSQALTPIEAANEMGSDRLAAVKTLYTYYKDEYETVFGKFPVLNPNELPAHASPVATNTQDNGLKQAWQALSPSERHAINEAYANLGKAIAAYEALLLPQRARFEQFVDALANSRHELANQLMNESEQAGLRLFISQQTQCLNCHSSALFSNRGFHNIGTGLASSGAIDFGRMLGVQAVLLNEFNCRSVFTDHNLDASNNNDNKDNKQNEIKCAELEHINRHEMSGMMRGAFRVPSLRGVTLTAPYMHDGRYKTLLEVVDHYAEPQPQLLGQMHEMPAIEPLSDKQKQSLVDFLETLDGGIAADPKWLRAPLVK